jgi:hypothetical protein
VLSTVVNGLPDREADRNPPLAADLSGASLLCWRRSSLALAPARLRWSRARISRLPADDAGGLAGLPAGDEAPRRLEVRERGRDREAEEGLERDGEDGDEQ